MSSIEPLSDTHGLPAIDEHLLAGEIPFEIRRAPPRSRSRRCSTRR